MCCLSRVNTQFHLSSANVCSEPRRVLASTRSPLLVESKCRRITAILIGYGRAIPLSEGPKEGNMTTMDLNQGSGNKGLKQTDKDSWTSLYLPAISAAI